MPDCLSEWRERFFAARRILTARPDGRPLYAYRLTDDEFLMLERVLREKVRSISSVAFLVEHDVHFAGLFVLHAAEWWRRHYQGGRWRWEPILDALSIDDNWNSNQRGECIEKGLRDWGIGNAGNQGHRFLGAIARQGGLPAHLLVTASGRLGGLLGEVIRLARGGNHTVETLRGWVDSLKGHLPASYRTDEILDLLTEVVAIVLDLTRNVPEKYAIPCLDWLNRNRPEWPEQFPFPMDDHSLQGMLGQLIQDAATRPSPAPKDGLITVARRLVPMDGEIWALQSSVGLPERIAADELVQMFGIDLDQTLPRNAVMSLRAGGSAHDIGLERLAEHGAYRLQFRPWSSSGEDAASEHFLRLTTAEGRGWNGLPHRGTALDPKLPWLFAEDGSSWRFVRQGGGGIVTTQGIVAVPRGWSVDGEQAELAAFLESPERELYRFSGEAQICGSSSVRSWRVHSDDALAVETDWRWQGQQVWEEFISPVVGFRGRPRLYDGNAVKPGLTWWTLSGQHASPTVYGPLEARLEVGGEIAYRAKMVILPDAARVEIRPNGPFGGLIRLVGWGAAGAEMKTLGLRGDALEHDDSLCIHVVMVNGGRQAHPPEWVELSLVWPENPRPARLRFPFPGKGVRAFDGDGRELVQDTWLPIHRLAGVRLVAVGINSRLELRLVLRYPNPSLTSHPEKPPFTAPD
jgi:hypothetical protein